VKQLLLTGLALTTLGATAQDLQSAITKGKVSLEVRTRYEYDQDYATAVSKSATALTNRLVLGYKTGEFNGVSATLQFLDVRPVLSVKNYNDGVNGKTNYASIKEPYQDRILQGYLEWKGLKVGRQTLAVDNQQFIGAGAWNQAPKSFTAATYKGNFGLPWMEVHAGHITEIVSSTNVARNLKMEFARVRFQPLKELAVTPFYYAANETTAPTTSYQHRGISADGSWNGILYGATFAEQSAYKSATAATVPDAKYRMGMIGYKYQGVSLTYNDIRMEKKYQTPEGALHGFYGWSDRVSSSNTTATALPSKGLEDSWFQANAKVYGVALEAQYHFFNAQTDGSHYGTEVDISADYAINKNFSVLAKFADYRGDGSISATSTDATKLFLNKNLTKYWLQTTYKF